MSLEPTLYPVRVVPRGDCQDCGDELPTDRSCGHCDGDGCVRCSRSGLSFEDPEGTHLRCADCEAIEEARDHYETGGY